MTANKKVISIVLGIMCFALTAGICIQARTTSQTDSTVSQNYEENNLRAEVLRAKERYDNKLKDLESAETELEKQRQDSTQNNEDLETKEGQIVQGNKVLGLAEVTGPGVIVTLSDGANKVTASDLLNLVNELRYAGAEAISINEIRVLAMTDIIDMADYSYIMVNLQQQNLAN